MRQIAQQITTAYQNTQIEHPEDYLTRRIVLGDAIVYQSCLQALPHPCADALGDNAVNLVEAHAINPELELMLRIPATRWPSVVPLVRYLKDGEYVVCKALSARAKIIVKQRKNEPFFRHTLSWSPDETVGNFVDFEIDYAKDLVGLDLPYTLKKIDITFEPNLSEVTPFDPRIEKQPSKNKPYYRAFDRSRGRY